jgi:uncharacterized repeat protein (TIGR01451 family)
MMRITGKRRVIPVAIIAALAATIALGIGAVGPALAAVSADLVLTKSDSPDPVAQGATLTYTIEVENLGPDPATNTTVEDKLPGGVTFLSMSATVGSCTRQGKTVTCNLGMLAMSAVQTVTITTRVTKKSGSIDNTASVSSDVIDPVATNNQDTEKTTIKAGGGTSCRGKPATIVGTAGDDRGASALVGTSGRDVIVALGGNDEVFSGGGADIVCSGPGLDLVRSGPRGDTVVGGGAGDRLIGGGGADELRGNAGRDRLRGGVGPDLLVGGIGLDRCAGGPGRDTLRSCP